MRDCPDLTQLLIVLEGAEPLIGGAFTCLHSQKWADSIGLFKPSWAGTVACRTDSFSLAISTGESRPAMLSTPQENGTGVWTPPAIAQAVKPKGMRTQPVLAWRRQFFSNGPRREGPQTSGDRRLVGRFSCAGVYGRMHECGEVSTGHRIVNASHCARSVTSDPQ